MGGDAIGSLFGGMFLLGLFIAVYIIFALPGFIIARKMGHESAWLAFVPIANIWLLCDIAGKEWWWLLLLFIPLINIVAMIVIWMGVAEAVEQPSWIGLLMLIPFVNFIVPFYLAFAAPDQTVRRY